MTTSTTSADHYAGLPFGQPELQSVMRLCYDEIIDFITTPEFRAVFAELYALPSVKRPAFVRDVLLDDTSLLNRGVVVPDGILIQRSAFGDRRPTLFVVKKYLPEGLNLAWENVNITFDDEYLDSLVLRGRDTCWRAPLQPAKQAQAMADGLVLEQV